MNQKIVANTMNDILGSFSKGSGFKTSIVPETTTAENVLLTNVGHVLGQIVFAGGIIFALLMLYASFLWMTAKGSEEKVTKAQKIFITSIAGVFILTSAAAIAYTVIANLSGNEQLL